MKYLIEIQAGEGGEDSKLFVSDLYGAYCKYMINNKTQWNTIYHQHGKIGFVANDAHYL